MLGPRVVELFGKVWSYGKFMCHGVGVEDSEAIAIPSYPSASRLWIRCELSATTLVPRLPAATLPTMMVTESPLEL